MQLNKIKKFTKKTVTPFLNKPVMLTYRWNDAQNIITVSIIESNYVVKYKKLDSTSPTHVVKIRYGQIDNIETLENIDNEKKRTIHTI